MVRRLEEAGAVLIAKLTVGTLALGDEWFGGMTRNPWNPEEGSSGSSAGSTSAVVAGLVGFALGSETLGSIVSPCRRCSASGLRPTFGRVSRFGCMTLSWSMDKIGPIARSLEDCALIFGAIHGADGLDPTHSTVQECHRVHWRSRESPRETCGGACYSRISCEFSRQLGTRRMANRSSIALLPALVAGLLAPAGPARAQSGWAGQTPVFDSDTRRVAEAAEAARAERRKSYGPVVYPKYMDGGERPDFKPAEPPIVYFDQAEEPGTIIVDTKGHKLFFVLPGKKAYQYPISVGRDGFTWSGTERISRVTAWPSWTPPPEMHKRVPGLPITVTGGLKNPQGARALYLGSTIYRIHGTNNDRTVGRANSSGCFRLTNEHVVHLASIAKVGTKVTVLQAYKGGVSQSAPLSSLFSFGGSEPAAATATGSVKAVTPMTTASVKTAQKKPVPAKKLVAVRKAAAEE